MRDERTAASREGAPAAADLSVRDREDRDDYAVLSALLDPDDHRGLWSVQELGRDRKDPLAVEDAVNRLLRAGLVNRQGEFIFATRAATHYRQIAR